MTVIKTGATALKFKQPKYIIATAFDGTETEGEEPKGDAYILETVVRDTTSVSQDDPETTDIECETSDSPIDSVTKLGKYQFSTEVADTQEKLSVALMGWTKEGNTKVLAPAGYTEKFGLSVKKRPESTFNWLIICILYIKTFYGKKSAFIAGQNTP